MVCLLGITISLITAAFIAHKFVYSLNAKVVDTNYGTAGAGTSSTVDETPQYLKNSTSIKPLLDAFVLNGIPFYATWCVVASHLNVGIVLVYKAGLTNSNACFLMLSVLLCVILFYWFL